MTEPDDTALYTLWLTGGEETPRRAAEDTVVLAGYMAEGRVRGYVIAFLRDDATVECKLGGEVERWAPRTLRSLAEGIEDRPRQRAMAAEAFAAAGLTLPPPRADEPLSERNLRNLAEALRRVLRQVGRT